MKTRIEKALNAASLKTFEEICFMYPVPELAEVQEKLPLEAAVEVKYRGAFTGKIRAEARGGLFQSLAVNMLSNQHPSETQKQDALGELANIICGNVIPALGGATSGYRIEPPRNIQAGEQADHINGEPLVWAVFNLNQGRADIKFYVDGYFLSTEKDN